MIGQRIGGYVLEEELGRGGMGAVYRARATDTLTRRARQELRPHELRAFERLLPTSD